MSPEERQLIAGLFDRMRGFSLGEKDKEAEALINEQMVSVRDAPYMLIQSVLVQEQALQQADARIRELEGEVRTLQNSAQQRPAASGGFLGGVFGSRPAAQPPRGTNVPSSVPTVGARATPPAYGSQDNRQGPQGWTGPQAAGGGFLQNAMSTAAGVAGGMLVAGAIGSLLGGGSSASAATPSSEPQAAAGNDSGTTQAAPQEPADAGADTSAQDAADEDGGWFGGDWFGGGDDGDVEL